MQINLLRTQKVNLELESNNLKGAGSQISSPALRIWKKERLCVGLSALKWLTCIDLTQSFSAFFLLLGLLVSCHWSNFHLWPYAPWVRNAKVYHSMTLKATMNLVHSWFSFSAALRTILWFHHTDVIQDRTKEKLCPNGSAQGGDLFASEFLWHSLWG